MNAWPWWVLLVCWAVFALWLGTARAIEPADPPPAAPRSLPALCVAPVPSPEPALDALLLARIADRRRAGGLPPLARSAAADAWAQFAVCQHRGLAALWQPSVAAYRALLDSPLAPVSHAGDERLCSVGVWHYRHPGGPVIGTAVYGRCAGVAL